MFGIVGLNANNGFSNPTNISLDLILKPTNFLKKLFKNRKNLLYFTAIFIIFSQ